MAIVSLDFSLRNTHPNGTLCELPLLEQWDAVCHNPREGLVWAGCLTLLSPFPAHSRPRLPTWHDRLALVRLEGLLMTFRNVTFASAANSPFPLWYPIGRAMLCPARMSLKGWESISGHQGPLPRAVGIRQRVVPTTALRSYRTLQSFVHDPLRTLPESFQAAPQHSRADIASRSVSYDDELSTKTGTTCFRAQ